MRSVIWSPRPSMSEMSIGPSPLPELTPRREFCDEEGIRYIVFPQCPVCPHSSEPSRGSFHCTVMSESVGRQEYAALKQQTGIMNSEHLTKDFKDSRETVVPDTTMRSQCFVACLGCSTGDACEGPCRSHQGAQGRAVLFLGAE